MFGQSFGLLSLQFFAWVQFCFFDLFYKLKSYKKKNKIEQYKLEAVTRAPWGLSSNKHTAGVRGTIVPDQLFNLSAELSRKALYKDQTIYHNR